MLKTLFSSLIATLLLYGCAPSASSESGAAPTAQALPVRPATSQAAVFHRPLLYQDDPRISYCEILENQNSTYSGFHDQQLWPLASLSKLITSAWALDQLGADYRFQSELYLNPVAGVQGQYDVLLRTHLDPIVNIEKLLYFISELNRIGVRQIRNLVIDENTRIYLGVLSSPHIELAHVPVSTDETIENLGLIFNSKNWADKTKTARANLLTWAQQNKKTVIIPDQFSVSNIIYKASNEINLQSYQSHITISSAPLYKYLKNMNVNSNNYLADAFFSMLGGASRFAAFQKNGFNLSNQELQIQTGSGLSDSSRGYRQDNLGSCFSMITVLSVLKNQAQQAELNLGHLLLNPSLDKDGTFETQDDYQSAVVLKTGRLYDVPAMNLAGFVSTEKGLMSFVFLGHDFTDEQATEIENSRAMMLRDLVNQSRSRSSFLSLDDSSIFF